ncbi:MAG: hypothetical protein K5979_06555 [Ruminococcus sp.]|nr:hypothetical protein [Ruminococcus sp.]
MDYKIMHKDKLIALGSGNRIYEIIEESLCPVCFSSNVSIDVWLANRSIDTCVLIQESCSRLCD